MILWSLFSVATLVLIEPALHCPFHSDDIGYIERNSFVHELSLENVLAILDPWGEPARNTANFAPVHLLAHAVEWWLWGSGVVAYHVVNALLHALAAALLVALLHARGLPLVASVAAGGLFLLHPANVETVAWIFQLKSILALSLAMGALLAHPRHPAVGILLFALALLSKASALLALPVAVAFTWVSGPRDSLLRQRGVWLLGWVAVLALYSVPALASFQRTGEMDQAVSSGLLIHLRTIVAIGMRYLLMALSGIGVSPFHEPEPARSWLDPWWLGGLFLGALLAWRIVHALLLRREEAAWWIWAAAGYLPISQVFRFAYPMADRYLYFILPGLIGAAFFAGLSQWPRLERRWDGLRGGLPRALTPGRVGALCAALVAIGYAVHSHEQARVWRSPATITRAAASNYPEGLIAHLLRAREAGLRGDAATCASELRFVAARGYAQFWELQTDAAFARVQAAPEIQEIMREMAGRWIDLTRTRSEPTYYDLYWRGHAHAVRAEYSEAEASFQEALRLGGDLDSQIRNDLLRLHSLSSRLQEQERSTAEGDEGR